MTMLLDLLTVLAGLVVLAVVAGEVVLGWDERLTRAQRIALCSMAAGLLWAAPARRLGYPPSLGDLLFIGSLASYVALIHGPYIWRRVLGPWPRRQGWGATR